MQLSGLNYWQFKGQSNEWIIENFTFNNINLIVGKNGTGKTRTLNVITGLSNLLSEKRKLNYKDGNYDAEFRGDQVVKYFLRYFEKKVTEENLNINGNEVLKRKADGTGTILFEEQGKALKFQTPTDQIAALARRDSLQHPFLESLYEWANSLVRFNFGQDMGQSNLILTEDLESVKEVSLKQTDRVVGVFAAAKNRFPNEFPAAIINDMNSIGYNIEEVGVATLVGLTIESNIPIKLTSTLPVGIYVKEKDIKSNTYQHDMSQGMFRALSLIIQLNYFLLLKKPGTILIDDIGEGLDFERASALIKILVQKVPRSNVQLIMSTNDRFVMNSVPIEYWIILNREGGVIRSLDYRNSKKIFDDFELTGLSNFDLLSTNYYKKGKKPEIQP